MVVRAACIASGLPPNVEPCSPAPINRENGFLTSVAPIGTPEPKPLANVTTSGVIPAH